MKYYDNNISDIYKELKSSANGISNSEADKLMAKYGKNELPKAKKQGIIGLFFSQFTCRHFYQSVTKKLCFIYLHHFC